MSAHITFDVEHQRIIRTDDFHVVEKSVNYLKAGFNLISEEWSEQTVTATFKKGDIVRYAILDDNDECIVPYEVLAESGELLISVFAGNLVTTNYATVYVYETGYGVGTEEVIPPSPTAYEQMLDYFRDSRDDVRNDKEFIEAAIQALIHIDGGLYTDPDWTGEGEPTPGVDPSDIFTPITNDDIDDLNG